MLALSRLKQAVCRTPMSMRVLIATEIPELFGRFGIMTSLALYLTQNCQQTDARAVLVFSTYLMLAAVTPMLGGLLADRLLGYKAAIRIGATMMLCGNVLMVVPSLLFLFIGLGVLVAGSGLFSPSLAALVSAVYQNQPHKRDQAFIAYYVAKNMGALLAPPLCGVIGVCFGYHYAFLLTSLVMMAGLLLFLRYQHELPTVSLVRGAGRSALCVRAARFAHQHSRLVSVGLMSVVAVVAIVVLMVDARQALLVVCLSVTSLLLALLFRQASLVQRRQLTIIVITMMALIAFLAINHLCGASFNLFVERLIDRRVMSVTLPTSVFYAIDPLFMLLFGALIAKLLAHIKQPHYVVACFSKFTVAMLVFALGLFCFVIAAAKAMAVGSASSVYVVCCYALCAVAELCIVPIALSLITRLAPAGLTGLSVGLFSFSDMIASYFTGLIAVGGSVPFHVHSLHTRELAAAIYHSVFAHLTLVLLNSAFVLFLVRMGLAYCYRSRSRLGDVITI